MSARCRDHRVCGPAASRMPIRTGGRPLEETVRARFEPRFGVDFSRVRIHADGEAAASARAFGAHAYTIGEHVVFGRGEYAPETARGARLLAHELTHVVDQSRGAVERGVQLQTLEAKPDATATKPIVIPTPTLLPPGKCIPRSDAFHYGCYCGSGKSCGDYSCPGIDALDECCRAHDKGYGDDCSFVDRMLGTARCKERIAAADVAFCGCLSKVVATAKGDQKSFAQNAIALFCIQGPKELVK